MAHTQVCLPQCATNVEGYHISPLTTNNFATTQVK